MRTKLDNEQACDTPSCIAGMRILLIEDTDKKPSAVAALLQGAGARVVFADGGRAAVRLFEKNIDEYDLVLMSGRTTGMDCYETASLLRSRGEDEGLHVPFVAVLESFSVHGIRKCMRSGIDGYLVKPLDNGALCEELAEWCAPELAHYPLIDLAEALERLGGDTLSYHRMLGEFREKGGLLRICKYWKSRSYTDVRSLLRSIAGTAGDLQLTRLSHAAKGLHDAFAKDADMRPHYRKLVRCYNDTLRRIALLLAEDAKPARKAGRGQ